MPSCEAVLAYRRTLPSCEWQLRHISGLCGLSPTAFPPLHQIRAAHTQYSSCRMTQGVTTSTYLSLHRDPTLLDVAAAHALLIATILVASSWPRYSTQPLPFSSYALYVFSLPPPASCYVSTHACTHICKYAPISAYSVTGCSKKTFTSPLGASTPVYRTTTLLAVYHNLQCKSNNPLT